MGSFTVLGHWGYTYICNILSCRAGLRAGELGFEEPGHSKGMRGVHLCRQRLNRGKVDK